MSCQNKKKKSAEGVSFAPVINPDVLKAQPRPGGAVPIIEFTSPTATSTPKSDKFKPKISEENVSKEFKIQTALDGVKPTMCELKDVMYMISVAISTVAMMAADYEDLPAAHMEMTKQLLETVKDDYGNHPPNVQGILNYIKMKTAKTIQMVARIRISER